MITNGRENRDIISINQAMFKRTPTRKGNPEKGDKLDTIMEMLYEIKTEVTEMRRDQKVEEMQDMREENEKLKRENQEIRDEIVRINLQFEVDKNERRKI